MFGTFGAEVLLVGISLSNRRLASEPSVTCANVLLEPVRTRNNSMSSLILIFEWF